MRKKCIILILFLSICFSGLLRASDKIFFKFDLRKEIGSTTWIYTQKSFDEAKDINADAIIINMNTYGGEVVFADSIRTRILNSSIPVYVFIDNNAASAGALIAISCDKIFMRKGSSIGAATVVNQTGEQMPDKYQSYMRATMRATAEAHGRDTIINGKDTTYKWKRDPLIAEAMVDERTEIPGISEAGKTLTFTTEEAIKHNYCDGTAETLQDVATKLADGSNFEIVEFKPTVWDNIKGFFLSPITQGLLIMLIIGGIYFEIQTPGIGFPLVVAATAAILYFVPLYIDGLAEYWEIILFIIGLVLLGLEIFVFPGFGIAGISGIVLIITGLALSLVDNVAFDFEQVQSGALGAAFVTVMVGALGGFSIIIYMSSKMSKKGMMFRKIALTKTMDNDDGYIGVSMEEAKLVGENGVASTDLRPSGKVKINNQVYDAISEEGFIEKGTPIHVQKYETGQVYVVKA